MMDYRITQRMVFGIRQAHATEQVVSHLADSFCTGRRGQQWVYNNPRRPFQVFSHSLNFYWYFAPSSYCVPFGTFRPSLLFRSLLSFLFTELQQIAYLLLDYLSPMSTVDKMLWLLTTATFAVLTAAIPSNPYPTQSFPGTPVNSTISNVTWTFSHQNISPSHSHNHVLNAPVSLPSLSFETSGTPREFSNLKCNMVSLPQEYLFSFTTTCPEFCH